MSFEVILPFLRPIAHLIEDATVTEIMVNGCGRIFVERAGQLELAEGISVREQNLRVAVRNLARVLGDDISEEQPLLDSRLPDGSRVAAVLPPVSLGGTTLTIRKFQSQYFTTEELVRIGTLTPGELDVIRQAIEARHNILISGGTGTGKTTLLNALTAFLPFDDRLVLIEDTAELQLEASNLVRFEARRQQPGLPAVTIRDLLRATLRHRPDRILVGEVRGGEAFDLLQALNTGHSGTLSTIHANSATQALRRFTSCVLQSGVDLPYTAIRHGIAECVQVLVHLERRHARRVVTELVHVCGYDPVSDTFDLHVLSGTTGMVRVPDASSGDSALGVHPPRGALPAADAGTLLRSGSTHDTSPLGGCCPGTAVTSGERECCQQLGAAPRSGVTDG
jgi:pilus assembly protein CpaF